MTIVAGLATLALAGCGAEKSSADKLADKPVDKPTGAPAFDAEQLAVLAAMDAHMLAISDNDLDLIRSQQTADGMTYSFYQDPEGAWQAEGQPNTYWVAPERAGPDKYKERYWSPTVLVRGGMALIWAPYQFWINDETSHCGIDAFSFAKINNEWKVTNAMWTMEPRACEELNPPAPEEMRPAG